MDQSYAAEGPVEESRTQDPLRLYVRQIGNGALLTREEERELARRKDAGDEGRTIRLPVHVADQVRRLLRARRQLAQKLNREPSLAELARETQQSEERVRELLELVENPVSLETPVGDGESIYGDMIEDVHAAAPHDQTAIKARTKELAVALDVLNPRMRRVLALRFGLEGETPRTLEEVGTQLGITRERVRQLETRALRELRLAAPGLEHYLRAE